MSTSTIEKPWQEQIVDQLGEDITNGGDAPDATHCAVLIAADETEALLLGRAENETAAVVLGEDRRHELAAVTPQLEKGELRILKLDDVYRWHRAHFAGEPEPELTGPTIEPQRQNVETDEPAEVDADGDEDDAEETPAPASIDANRSGDGKQLFDPSQYDREDLQIQKIDGQSIDRISVKFTGEIHLDRSDPADVAIYNDLKLGKDVQILCEARCNSTGAKGATDRDGDLDVVVGTKGIKVHSLMKPAGGDWVTDTDAA